MANIFVHFEPTGPLSEPPKDVFTGDLPPYLIPGMAYVCLFMLGLNVPN